MTLSIDHARRRPTRFATAALFGAVAWALQSDPIGAQQAQTAKPIVSADVNAPYAANPGYIRFGAPIALSGRVLPANATGSITFSLDGTPFQTSPLSQQVASDYIALGDSITYAGYIADPAQRYQALVGQKLNLDVTTYASPGYTACDAMLYNIVPNGIGETVSASPLYSLLIGANEALLYGPGPNEALFNRCDQAALSWLGVSRANKILIGDAGITVLSGSWTSSPSFAGCCYNALTNTAGSGTVRFTLTTSGGAAYLWYLLQAATPGSFSLQVDGAAVGSGTSTLFPPNVEAIAGSYALLRVPVAAGVHTFDIAAQSGTVSIFGMGTAPATSQTAPPTVLASDVQFNQDPSLLPSVLEYTSDIEANIALLRADGLDLRFVPTQQYMFATAAEMMDSRHPNALGLSELAQAFESVITPAAPVTGAFAGPEASVTLSAVPLGSHTLAVHYSGDTNYAPADAGYGVSIYDGSSTVGLTSANALYPVNTPITLTANVPQSSANGAVNFFEVTPAGNIALGSVWLAQNFGSITLPSLAAGAHALVAQYLGDVHYNGATSAQIAVTVDGTYTTTTLTTTATKYFGGSPVTLTANVTPASGTGTVTFFDGSAQLAQIALHAGAASYTTSALATGVHSLNASFSGNATQDGSQSPALAVEIDANPATIAIAPIPASLVYGTPLVLAATVSPATATGGILFKDSLSAQTLGQASFANGAGSLTIPAPVTGSHSFTAVYSGDTLNLPAVSSPVTTQVTAAASTIVLAPIPASLAFGDSVTLTATVTPSAATGTVTFTDSASGTLAQASIVNGVATFATSALAVGPQVLSATYSGDSFRTSSASANAGTTVTPTDSATFLATLPATIYAGNALSLAATITPASSTGTVVFRDAALGTLGQATIAHGTAAITLPSPAIASYAITAVYSGDADDTASTSNTVATQVLFNSTTILLTASANPAPVGSSITLTVSAAATATGFVTFFDGASPLGSALLGNGKAALSLSSLDVGTHTLRATYAGDALNAASTSSTLSETIAPSTSATSLTLAQNSVVIGSAITFNISIASSLTIPSGSVTIRSGTTILATGNVANAATGAAYATLSASSTALGLGTFPLVATYSGDTDDTASDSRANPVYLNIVAMPTSTTLSLSAAQVPLQAVVRLTASITAAATPTGSVSFLSNGNTIATANVNAAGIATASVSSLGIGDYAITASYAANGNFAVSASTAQSLDVTPPLTLALAPATLNLAPGDAAASTLKLTPLSGFTGATATTCQTTASWVACSVDSVPAFTGAAPVSANVHIHIATTAAASTTPTPPGTRTLPIVLALILPVFAFSRRRLRPLALLLFAIAIAGCAEGGDFGTVPPGAQIVTVSTVAAGVTITTFLTVDVSR